MSPTNFFFETGINWNIDYTAVFSGYSKILAVIYKKIAQTRFVTFGAVYVYCNQAETWPQSFWKVQQQKIHTIMTVYSKRMYFLSDLSLL